MMIDADSRAKALVNLALNALQNGDKEYAFDNLLKALELVPDLPEALIAISKFEPVDQEILITKAALFNSKNVSDRHTTLWHLIKNDQLGGYNSEHENQNNLEVPPTKRIIPIANDMKFSGERQKQKPFVFRFFSRWQALVSVFIILLFLMISMAAPRLAPQPDPENPSPLKKSCESRAICPTQPPNEKLPLGSVAEFDVYHSLIWGTRQAVTFGFSTALITAVIGSILGLWAGYAGGKITNWILRIADAFLCFPHIAAVALFSNINMLFTRPSYATFLAVGAGTEYSITMSAFQKWILSFDPVFLSLVLFSWMPYTRILRTQTQLVKKMQYIDAARVIGVKPARILFRHILPNASPPAIVLVAKDIGRMVVLQATFSFLGMGSESAWGILLARATKWIIGIGIGVFRNWWVFLPITLALLLFGLAWNLLGDELNRWLNPREAGKIF